MRTIVYSASSNTTLRRMAPDVRAKLEEALVHFVLTGEGDVKRLSGVDAFRLRVGSYRITFRQDATTVTVALFAHRGRIYR